jgi:uncharacterized membrane protein YfcA
LELWQYALLAAVGGIAGFLNVMAGGGSLLTMPAMIFLGMPPALANGTNRVALFLQNAAAVAEFRREGQSDFKRSISLALCTIPGAVAGAIAAVRIDPLWFKRLLAVVMVAVLILVLRKRKKGAPREEGDAAERPAHPFLAHLGMVAVGFYGGFIQAGVGFILMAILQGLLRLDLVRVNMHKVFIVGLYMLPSLLVFALLDQVFWLAGLALGLGTGLGGFFATRLQIKRGEGVIRIVFALAVVAMAARLVFEG